MVRRYGLRDAQWERIKGLLLGRVETVVSLLGIIVYLYPKGRLRA